LHLQRGLFVITPLRYARGVAAAAAVALLLSGCGRNKTDLGDGGAVVTGSAGWSNSNEGKVIAAAFLDAHNRLVAQVRELQARDLPPPVATKAAGKG
jgi:hypothetical protein